MIKKTLRNAAVGTIAAGAMILPAATTVAPQLQLVACNPDYEDSRFTNTEQELSRYAINRGGVTSTVTVETLNESAAPRGTVTVTVYRPGGGVVKSKSKSVGDNRDTVTFGFGGFGNKKKPRGTYTFVATFEGNCRYTDSGDEDRLVVMGRR